jgi:coproporphyrinogen III oxidase
MEHKSKNIKISQKHHEMLKDHCDKNGLKMYRVIEKWIDEYLKPKKKDIYGEV